MASLSGIHGNPIVDSRMASVSLMKQSKCLVSQDVLLEIMTVIKKQNLGKNKNIKKVTIGRLRELLERITN